jgi:RIO kinase 1
MSYHGDEMLAAPILNSVGLEPNEANDLFQEVLRNIDLMLQQDLIHGDLSAYNILYWEGELVVIDFPQVVNLHNNRKARYILKRDITRVCEYFAQQGVQCYPRALFTEFWQRYVEDPDPEDVAADQSRLELHLADLVEEAGGRVIPG